MSSDGFFDDDFDSAALTQLDAIEAAYTTSTQATVSNQAVASTSRTAQAISKHRPLNSAPSEDSYYDLTLDLDDEDFEKLDNMIRDSYAGKTKMPVGPTRQTTLFGDVLRDKAPTNKPSSSSRQPMQRTTSKTRNPFGSKPKKTKVWDQTAFARSGQGKKGKGKDVGDQEEEGFVEFEQFPAPFVSPDKLVSPNKNHLLLLISHPPPMKLKPDLLEAKHWLYPLNKPKRDYQFNIIKKSLFENTIISVPTGMGKTFIAGVVMLNYYRWFPEGKVVFVAPTKPLVAQQIDASHQSCGIPGNDAAEMTGEIPKAKRERLWREKRVFYMTPQTLMNDLATQNCDVMDIVLIVIDEAHKATGDYAYNQIVRWMMAKNPHFRLIALTATPGSNPVAVQNLVDGLHISNIEIRDENSLDLRPYLQEKKIEQHCIKMPEAIVRIRDSLANLMDTYLKPLKAAGVMWPELNPVRLHPYSARGKIPELPPHQRDFIGQLSMLGNLAQAMGYLLEGTIGMAYSYLKESSERDAAEHATKNQQIQSKKLRESELFKKTMGLFEACRETATGPFPAHPKLEKLLRLLIDFYGQKLPDGDIEDSEEEPVGESKTMVFVTHREAVDEIVEALNTHRPLIRASRFIGQGMDKHGKRGQAQKEQLEIIQNFKGRELNVLVATCIGEEGLDIGEVDLIICYDTQKTPIRMLQRLGRTGRKRAGYVHLLLAEHREEFNLDKARASYKEVQKSIWRGEDLEFYSDVKRLIPDHVKPTCLERVMEIRPYVREERGKGKRSPAKTDTTTKHKRIDDMMRNIPSGACTGFVNASKLTVKKRKVEDPKSLEEEGKGKMKRAATESTAKTKTKPRKKKKETEEGEGQEEEPEEPTVKGKGKGKAKRKTKLKEPSLTLSQQGRDDSLDRELETGPLGHWEKTSKKRLRSPSVDLSPPARPMPKRSKKLSLLKEDTVMGLSDRETECHRSGTPFTQAGSCLESKGADDNMAWLVDDDDEPDIVILSSSPAVPKNTKADLSIEIVGASIPDNPDNRQGSPRKSRTPASNDEVLELSSEPDVFITPSSPTSPESKTHKEMPPPSCRSTSSRPQPSPHTLLFEDTQPVRRIGRLVTKRHLPPDEASSDAEEMPPPSQRRLRRYEDSPEPQQKKRKTEKKSKPLAKRKHNPLLEYSAEHSGDEVSAGSSNSDDDVESESDHQFIKDSPMTQISPSYDQTLAYRKSLMTQAPGGGPNFANGPMRNKPFGRMEPRVRRRVIDSSPPPEDDDYEFGSFVVDNDADISYLTQADDPF
ncbi:ATP-dependent DNA helicase mfh1 [Leucoagaricus sp. SymC.cos]|nr:ATP-dependent DNA helicase mfh1 [Leucoagaricus sp. SymC.cos]